MAQNEKDLEFERALEERKNEAIEKFSFKYCYKVSPDKKLIYAFSQDKKPTFVYILKRYLRHHIHLMQTLEKNKISLKRY